MKPEEVWVLRQVGDVLDGWYWCGLGNPRFRNSAEATPYHTYREARTQAKYLRTKLRMGSFKPERLTGERVGALRYPFPRKLSAPHPAGSSSRTVDTPPCRACTP
jgi:hypothetical protein